MMFQKQLTQVFCKNVVPRNFSKFTGKQLYQSLFNNFNKKETLARVFFCESCEISKKTLLKEHLQATASV